MRKPMCSIRDVVKLNRDESTDAAQTRARQAHFGNGAPPFGRKGYSILTRIGGFG
jgi:hypothetical protein